MHLYIKERSEVLTSSRMCVLCFPILQIKVSLALKEDSIHVVAEAWDGSLT